MNNKRTTLKYLAYLVLPCLVLLGSWYGWAHRANLQPKPVATPTVQLSTAQKLSIISKSIAETVDQIGLNSQQWQKNQDQIDYFQGMNNKLVKQNNELRAKRLDLQAQMDKETHNRASTSTSSPTP